MKPRHLVLIVLIGAGLIAVAPTSEKAGQAEKITVATAPARDAKVVPAQEAKVGPASFTGSRRELKKQ